jgi:hypothetical protein
VSIQKLNKLLKTPEFNILTTEQKEAIITAVTPIPRPKVASTTKKGLSFCDRLGPILHKEALDDMLSNLT